MRTKERGRGHLSLLHTLVRGSAGLEPEARQ